VEEEPDDSDPSEETEEGNEDPEITPSAPEKTASKILGGCILGGVTIVYGAYGTVRALKRKESDEA
jgi:hypothetical protein